MVAKEGLFTGRHRQVKVLGLSHMGTVEVVEVEGGAAGRTAWGPRAVWSLPPSSRGNRAQYCTQEPTGPLVERHTPTSLSQPRKPIMKLIHRPQ